jgi:hypothetical protein
VFLITVVRILVLYRQVRRRGGSAWTRVFPRRAPAIGGFEGSRWRLRRARGSYAFCLGVSKFVRLQGGLMAGVSKVGWSLGSEWEALGWSFFTGGRAGLGWAATSRDTTAGWVVC